MDLGIKRRKIEDKITDCYHAVDWDAQAAAWVDSQTFEDFVFSFLELRRYYELSDDVAVGLGLLRTYMDGLRALQTAAADRSISIDRQESAARLIYELNHQMEAVKYEVDRNRQDAEANDQGGTGGIPMRG